MTLADAVRAKLGTIGHAPRMKDALLEAERLADLYADVKPVPYIVPMERYVGVPYHIQAEKNAC